MGYSTYWGGSLTIAPPLTPEQVEAVNEFCFEETSAPGRPEDGGDWFASEDGTTLMSAGEEKINGNVEWLEEIVRELLAPWGCKVDGRITRQGERVGDVGIVTVTGNEVTDIPLESLVAHWDATKGSVAEES